MDYPLSQLRKYQELSPVLIADLIKRIRIIEPKRNNTLLLPGDICRDLYLIEKGVLACYDHESDRKYCSWIMTPGDFVTAVDSFNRQVISTESIVALTKSRLYALNRQDFEHLTMNHSEFQNVRQILTDKYHIQSRVMDAKRKRPSEQFYDYLRKEFPEVVAQAPITALASLMGITRQRLHKIIKSRSR
ncbi:MAG TPA: cyclic nucleotide-binding domain-containing protein [Puia sp.]|jgi:CRP-like cAMP-binding protein|nr:cyclic nucleotide-binding domain-containing protein [Puia sp.]